MSPALLRYTLNLNRDIGNDLAEWHLVKRIETYCEYNWKNTEDRGKVFEMI